ncbi:MAG: LysE family translocator [Chloroflexi bacterium]|nr:LysE family translocator [Chloroflexota bacterium]
MDGELLWRGFILGLAIAAPVGPVGALCIRRTLAEGRLTGFISGLGAATADLLYGCLAAFGLTAVSAFLTAQQMPLRIVGGAFLLYLGVRTIFTPPPADAAIKERGKGLLGAYFSTLLLTLTNPITILAYVGIFSGLGLGQGTGGYAGAGLLVLGVFLGSAGWWLFLTTALGLVRQKIGAGLMVWINRIAGVAICAFGLWAILGVLL